MQVSIWFCSLKIQFVSLLWNYSWFHQLTFLPWLSYYPIGKMGIRGYTEGVHDTMNFKPDASYPSALPALALNRNQPLHTQTFDVFFTITQSCVVTADFF